MLWLRRKSRSYPQVSTTDGHGLVLRVTDNGRRAWVLRTRFQRKATNLGLGSYPGTTLAQARRLPRTPGR